MEKEKSCAFTGHRPEKLPWGQREEDPRCLHLKERLAEALLKAYADGYRHFISGMARGTDLYFCEAALELRDAYPQVTVEAAVPYPGQADHWTAEEIERYQSLLARCDFETVVQHHYSPGCLQRRNRYLVDRAGRIISVYKGSGGGGTLYTLNYAMNQGLDVVILEP